jgi:hypothetical protein
MLLLFSVSRQRGGRCRYPRNRRLAPKLLAPFLPTQNAIGKAHHTCQRGVNGLIRCGTAFTTELGYDGSGDYLSVYAEADADVAC